MAGTCITNLAAEVRASGQHDLAARIVHAAEHDIHISDHAGMYFDDCDFCCAECAAHDLDMEHDGTMSPSG